MTRPMNCPEELQHSTLSTSNHGVVTLQVANGTALNLLDSATILELTQVLRRLSRDPRVRALVVRGSGDRAFVGGADVKELARLDPDSAVAFIKRLSDLCEAVRDFPVPTIARLAGWCMGAGMELAAACDIRIGTSETHVAMPEVRIGIPSVIHANILSRLIGEGRTRWLLLTGMAVGAQKAEQWGFLSEVAQPHELDAAIDRVVAEILQCGPAGVRAQKDLLRKWEEPTIERGLKESIHAFGCAYEGTEPAQYMQRFLDRKRPREETAAPNS